MQNNLSKIKLETDGLNLSDQQAIVVDELVKYGWYSNPRTTDVNAIDYGKLSPSNQSLYNYIFVESGSVYANVDDYLMECSLESVSDLIRIYYTQLPENKGLMEYRQFYLKRNEFKLIVDAYFDELEKEKDMLRFYPDK